MAGTGALARARLWARHGTWLRARVRALGYGGSRLWRLRRIRRSRLWRVRWIWRVRRSGYGGYGGYGGLGYGGYGSGAYYGNNYGYAYPTTSYYYGATSPSFSYSSGYSGAPVQSVVTPYYGVQTYSYPVYSNTTVGQYIYYP